MRCRVDRPRFIAKFPSLLGRGKGRVRKALAIVCVVLLSATIVRAASPQLASHAMPSLHLTSPWSEPCLLVVRSNHSLAPTLAPSHRR